MNPQDKLSDFCSYWELVHTNYAVPNVPNEDQIANARALAINVIDPVRRALNRAINFSSWFRCPALNSHPAIKGAKDSQHLTGGAADIYVNGMTPLELATFIVNMGIAFDQIIVEPSWVHISFKRFGPQRMERLHKVPGGYMAGLS